MRLAAAMLAAAMPALCLAAEDPGGPPGAVQTAWSEKDPGRYALPIGPAGPEHSDTLALSGRVLRQAYRLDDPGATTAGVMAHYRERLAAQGLEPMFDCTAEDCGGLDFRFAVDLIEAPAMLMDAIDFAQLSAGSEGLHVSVLVSRMLNRVHVQTVTVWDEGVDAPSAEAPPLASAPLARSPVAEGTGPEERALLRRLDADGHVPVEGLEFATGGATLSNSSGPALDRLARLLTGDPALSVVIVGHTDNQGPAEINLSLSRQRAEAVRAALVARGVPSVQLAAEGVGFLAPLTTNATEAGRAANRRVELVRR